MKSIVVPLLMLSVAVQQAFAFQVGTLSQNWMTAFKTTKRATTTTTSLQAVSYDIVASVGYSVSVKKPLGVIFGENPDPYYGLVVDDVSEGLNGGMAGLRLGDQLLSVGGQVVVGKEFDEVMSLLQAGPTTLDLVMYRGPVSSLFTIISNRLGDDALNVRDDNYDDDDGSEPIIMDENYESPVKIEVKEEKPLTAGDVFKAMGKLGKMVFEDDTPPEQKQQQKEKKKGGGFFGFGAEAIQLDGDDAKGLK